MTEKQIYTLKISEHFKKLISPLSLKDYKQLEENIIKEGCKIPIKVWKNIIIDGHNRYEICTKFKIPFNTQQIDFNNSNEAISWICINQLRRRNISEETRRYLIGKRYDSEKVLGIKIPSERNQDSKKGINISIYKKPEAKENCSITVERLSKEFQVSERTIRQYASYARIIDELAKGEPELMSEILTGKVKISYKNILKLSKLSSNAVNKIKKQLNDSGCNLVSYSDIKTVAKTKTEKVTVKDMPEYDPDAEISSLALTIPSWISSIDRTLSMANFDRTSDIAKTKLQNELKNLEYTVKVMLLAAEEK